LCSRTNRLSLRLTRPRTFALKDNRTPPLNALLAPLPSMLNRQTAVIYPDQSTYTYDKLGRRIGRTLPAGQSESYGYDNAGNLKTKTDFNGKTTTYTYDTSNRLLTKVPDARFNAPTVTFTYFNNGLRHTMADVSTIPREIC